ncbi:MAG: Rne/Rng family ribonuclease [Bacteroidaceae bacterium]|nr:Rne/Rng family ribonuclease [Bacteroidaceae bacterium]
MTSEVIVDVQPKEISIALLEDKRLVEFQRENRDTTFSVGNVYLARVKKIMPGLNACFVNVGYKHDAFLHYQDLGSDFNTIDKYLKQILSNKQKLLPIDKAKPLPAPEKNGSIQSVLQLGQEILVQVAKEPISTKGPRLTCELSFAGRNLVLTPFGNKVSVSGKIKDSEEKARLKQLITSIKPNGFSVIVRTSAEGKKSSELDSELHELIHNWEEMLRKAQKAKELPALVFEETNRTMALLRDLFNKSYESIYLNDEETLHQVQDYIQQIAPDCKNVAKLYTGKLPIFDNYDVTRQIKSGFGKTVNYKNGAYLVIEHTEALHVVDVNSGIRSSKSEERSQETNALEVNLGAADEIARQMRLRDMGGIIVVDFIDMSVAEDRQKLYERMCENMKRDRARHNILPLSKFGLMQITRQRVRPVTDVEVEEVCPTCHGTGVIKSSYLFTEKLEEKISHISCVMGLRNFALHVHPYVAAYLNQGFISIKRRWQMAYGFGLSIVPSQKLAFLQYEVYDKDGQMIEI